MYGGKPLLAPDSNLVNPTTIYWAQILNLYAISVRSPTFTRILEAGFLYVDFKMIRIILLTHCVTKTVNQNSNYHNSYFHNH